MTEAEQAYVTTLKQAALDGAVRAMEVYGRVERIDVAALNNALKPRIRIVVGGKKVMFDVTLDIVPVAEG